MRSVPISHSITGPLARSIGPGFTGAERGKALTNAGGPSGPPFGVHYRCRWDNGAFSSHFYVARTPSVPLMGQTLSPTAAIPNYDQDGIKHDSRYPHWSFDTRRARPSGGG